MTKICKRCATPFEGHNKAAYCDDCKATKRFFVGIDGEGFPINGIHTYTLLSVGDRTITNGQGLDHEEVFSFMWDCYKEDTAKTPKGMSLVYVGFFLKYDFTQWIKSLPAEAGMALFSKKGIEERKDFRNQRFTRPIFYRGWEINFLHGMKRMTLKKYGESGVMYINDCGSMFNESFLKVIEPSRWEEGFITQAEYDVISAGKESRGTDFAGITEYNVLENDLLARVLTEYDKGFRSVGLNIRSTEWYGTGPIAQSWLNSIDAPICKSIPEYVDEAAREAYYAGWMEIYNHGHVKDVYAYDINSAYPHVIASLPCLDCGFWVAEEQGDYVLMNCRVDGSSDEMGPLPKRLGTSGMLTRPKNTIGWYWKSEIEAAERAGLVESFTVEECYSYIPADCGHQPFARVADLYTKRLESGKAMRNVYKTIINSVYGKLAQEEGKYNNWVYASLITSGCRVQILDAIATHPMGAQDVVMVSTDAVYFRSEHKTLPKSNKLGDWKETHWDKMTLFLPGMYWGKCDGEDGLKIRSRGVSEKAFKKTVKKIDRAFTASALIERVPDATFTVKVDFDMVTPQQAIRMNDWNSAGRVSETTREFSLKKVNKKRDLRNIYKDRGVLRSYIMDNHFGLDSSIESAPYSERFRMLINEGMEATQVTAKDYEGSGIGC